MENTFKTVQDSSLLDQECRTRIVFSISESSFFSFPSPDLSSSNMTAETERHFSLTSKEWEILGTDQGLQPHCPVGRIWMTGVLRNAHPLNFICQIFTTHRYTQILKNFLRWCLVCKMYDSNQSFFSQFPRCKLKSRSILFFLSILTKYIVLRHTLAS